MKKQLCNYWLLGLGKTIKYQIYTRLKISVIELVTLLETSMCEKNHCIMIIKKKNRFTFLEIEEIESFNVEEECFFFLDQEIY